MNYRQAIKIMSDLVPDNIYWSLDLDHDTYPTYGNLPPEHKETRRIYLHDPIHKFFGDEKTWQSAVDQALVALRDKGLIK